MTLKRSKPAPLATVTGSGIAHSPTDCGSGYPTFYHLVQEQIDAVTLLAARSGIDAASVRAQLDVWQIGGRS